MALADTLLGLSQGLLSQGFTKLPQTGFEGLGAGLQNVRQRNQFEDQQALRQQALQQAQQQNVARNQLAQASIDQRAAAAQNRLGQPTALQRNLQAAGLNPGTPGFRDAVLKGTQQGNTVNVVNKAESELAKSLNKSFGENFIERRTGAIDAAKTLENTEQARKLLDRGVITGFGADFKVGLGKALQAGGVNIAEDAIANSEAFAGQMAQEVARIVKQFGAGTGLSDADREFAIKAAGGDINLTEKSIRRLIDINERAAGNIIKRFNDEAARLPQNITPFPLGVTPGVTQPPAPPPSAPAANAVSGTTPSGLKFKVIP